MRGPVQPYRYWRTRSVGVEDWFAQDRRRNGQLQPTSQSILTMYDETGDSMGAQLFMGTCYFSPPPNQRLIKHGVAGLSAVAPYPRSSAAIP
jgi:hypothetical protein